MSKAKSGSVKESAIRVRLTIPRDSDGLVDYLRGIDPSTLNFTLCQLAYLGFLFKSEALRNASVPATTHSRLAAVSGSSSEQSIKKVEQSSHQVGSGDADTDMNNFERMFSESHKVAMR